MVKIKLLAKGTICRFINKRKRMHVIHIQSGDHINF